MKKQNTVVVKAQDFPIEKLEVPESQKKFLIESGQHAALMTSMEEMFKDEIESLTEKLSKNPDIIELKNMKRDYKTIKKSRVDAAIRYNGALKMAMSGVRGETLKEKMETLTRGKLLGTGGSNGESN
jgi:hypothetical protein